MLFVKATKDFRCKVDFPGNETCFFWVLITFGLIFMLLSD
jgi:hypothetical protein